MFCLTCNQDRSPLRIGSGDYCAVCGNRLTVEPGNSGDASTAKLTAAGSTPTKTPRRSLDFGPTRRPSPQVSSRLTSPGTTAPAASTAGTTNRLPVVDARQLHSGSSAPGTLDLRRSAAPARPAAARPGTPYDPTAHVDAATPAVSPADIPTPTRPGINMLAHGTGLKPKDVHPALALEPELKHEQAAPTTPTTPTAAPSSAHPSSFLQSHASGVKERLEHAKSVERSGTIAKFNQFTPAKATSPAPAHTPMPAAAVTHHESLSRLISQMPVSHVPTNNSSRATRIGAIAGAIVVMGGYIWLQNSPKLAIRSAGNQAGLTATLPGYLPSSYHLASTTSAPGLVTLSFKSPSQNQNMNIIQQRTDWDSRSLLDNVVAKAAPDYSSVQGQGLTVYLFNKNQAAWINHGMRYSIVGAQNLSREQILKIAYSL